MSITPDPPPQLASFNSFFRSDAHLKFNPFTGNQVRMTFYGFARRMMKTFSAEKYRLVCSLRLGKIFEQRFVCAWLEGEEKNIKYHQMAFQCYDIKDVPYSLPNCFPFFSKPANIPQECSCRNFLNSDEIMYSYCIAGCTIESYSLTPIHSRSQFLSGLEARGRSEVVTSENGIMNNVGHRLSFKIYWLGSMENGVSCGMEGYFSRKVW